MELLLAFLSLLTAATGALTGARAPDAGVQQLAQVDIIRTAATAAAVTVQAVAAPRTAVFYATPVTAEPSGRAFAVASPVPLYADRLIE